MTKKYKKPHGSFTEQALGSAAKDLNKDQLHCPKCNTKGLVFHRHGVRCNKGCGGVLEMLKEHLKV